MWFSIEPIVHNINVYESSHNDSPFRPLSNSQIQRVLGGLLALADRGVQALVSQGARGSDRAEPSRASRRPSRPRPPEDVRESRLWHRTLAIAVRLARSRAASGATISWARAGDVVFDKKPGAKHAVRSGNHIEVCNCYLINFVILSSFQFIQNLRVFSISHISLQE